MLVTVIGVNWLGFTGLLTLGTRVTLQSPRKVGVFLQPGRF